MRKAVYRSNYTNALSCIAEKKSEDCVEKISRFGGLILFIPSFSLAIVEQLHCDAEGAHVNVCVRDQLLEGAISVE